MMTLLILLGVIAAAVVIYRMRVPLLAKVLGQSETRVRGHLERRRR